MLSSHGMIKKLRNAGWKRVRSCGKHAVFAHPDHEGKITLPLAAGKYILKLANNLEEQSGINLKKGQ